MSARVIERFCMALTVLWLVLSWTAGDDGSPNTAVVISSVFLAAALVIGALRS